MNVLLNQDYRSRAIGIVAALGVLITGVVVTGAQSASAPAPRRAQILVEEKGRVVVAARPVTASRLETRCDPFC